MDEQIKQIAMRLHGLRDALDLTVEQVAEKIGVTPEQYAAMESGEKDLSVSTLQKISTEFGTYVRRRTSHALIFPYTSWNRYFSGKNKGLQV